MGRLWLAAAGLAALAALAAWSLRVDSDARGLLGAEQRLAAGLDTPHGRMLTLAVIDADREKRSEVAREVAREIRKSPLVARVFSAPEAPPGDLLDWLWRYRFVLAPPAAADLEAASMAAELSRARTALTSVLGGALADRFLLDPTGSFRRVVAALSGAAGQGPSVAHGILQSRDDSAALLFILLADQPLDVARQSHFDAGLTAMVEERGAEALLVGPRSVSARISEEIAGRAKAAALIACALVLAWLAAVLRSAPLVLVCLLPLGIGLSVAVLTVGLAFGSVHVVALGFGGALVGLALDYPVHLLGHGASAAHRARARRNVLAGAATTAIAFLALIGSGIPALMQVGVFVASGLIAAAACSVGLVRGQPDARLRVLPALRRSVAARWKVPLLLAAALVAAGILALASGRAPQRLLDIPAPIVRDIERMDTLVDLPSGRYRIEVSAGALQEVLDLQARLAAPLDAARRAGAFSRTDMLAARLPPRPASSILIGPTDFSRAAESALAAAGLAASFRKPVVDAYIGARETAPLKPDALAPLLRLAPLAQLIRADGETLHAPVRLWDVTDPRRISAAIDELGLPGVRFVDQEAVISASLDVLRGRVAGWMVLGAAAGILFLLVVLRPAAAVAELAGSCVVAGLVSAALAGMIAGGISVFHVAAFALVIGIGIDYGLFLTLSRGSEEYVAAARSVLVCATTTLIAFLTMALSGVTVLEHIGTAVSLGVVLMLAVHVLRRPKGFEGTE